MARSDIDERVDRLELPFNSQGVDLFGVSKKHLAFSFKTMSLLYRRYFGVKASGLENIPARGRAMLVGNHSGGVAIDGMMVWTACFLEMNPPRLAQGMADKFLNTIPFSSVWTSRTGNLTGLPEHAERLLRSDRLLMVFPEGARGTAKLYPDRNSLVDFGSGFMRLAMKTGTPIVPFGFVGGGDAIPTVSNLYALGKLLGVPYLPMTPYLLPIPRPVKLAVHFGAPLSFPGDGTEEDEAIGANVDQVKDRIAALIEEGREARRTRLFGRSGT